MKKSLVLLLVLGLLASFSACKKKSETVTIYIPATLEVELSEGDIYDPVDINFADGWQDKKQFSVTYYLNMDGTELRNETIYGDKTMQTTSGGKTTVTVYDEQGRTVKQTATGTLSNDAEKVEAITEYDENGRVLKKTQTIYYGGGKENEVSVLSYTYSDLVEGSEGVAVLDSYTYKLFYDSKYRCVGSVTIQEKAETSRTEYTYDEYGNLESTTTFVGGEQDSRTVYTYKAVEITLEKAEKLPQFVRAK